MVKAAEPQKSLRLSTFPRDMTLDSLRRPFQNSTSDIAGKARTRQTLPSTDRNSFHFRTIHNGVIAFRATLQSPGRLLASRTLKR